METMSFGRACVGALAMVAALAAPASAQRAAKAGTEASSASPTAKAERQRATAAVNNLPIRFEPTQEHGTFLARGIGAGVRLSGTSIDFPKDPQRLDSIRINFGGARQSSQVVGVDPLPGRVNYLYGDDPTEWRTNVLTYAGAQTKDLYRGIDVHYYGAEHTLEYDFIVHPGARPETIRVDVKGTSVRINQDGDLVYGDGTRVLLRKPVAYQTIDGRRRDVIVAYDRRKSGRYGFTVGPYDRSVPLVIDPIVVYTFTLGGNDYDFLTDIALDGTGAVYVSGSTRSNDFPFVNPVPGPHNAGDSCDAGAGDLISCSDGFLAKLAADGSALVYATYVGGADFDSVDEIVVDESHAVYFIGWGGSVHAGQAVVNYFIGKLNSEGSQFLYRTVVAGIGYTDPIIGNLAVSSTGSVYVTTERGVATLSPIGDNFHSIFTLPEDSVTSLEALIVRGDELILGGRTWSPSFTTTAEAPQRVLAGGSDGVLMRLATNGVLNYSTFLGGTGDDSIDAVGIGLDGSIYAGGNTASSDFPHGSSDTAWDPNQPNRVFVARLIDRGRAISYARLLPYPQAVIDPSGISPPTRILLNANNEAYAAACALEFEPGVGSDKFSCQLWRFDGDGTVLWSTRDIQSRIFAIDQSGEMLWFGVTTLTSPSDTQIVKIVPGLTLPRGLPANVLFPARFGTPITWMSGVFDAAGPVEYLFARYDPSAGWMVVQPFGPNASYFWTPGWWDVGDHALCVFARLVGSSDLPLWTCRQFTIAGLSPGEPPIFSAAADFDSDDRPDLIWIDSATSQLATWSLGGGGRGERVLSGGYLNSPALPVGWRVAGSADIDGDGHTDLILQSDSGQLGAWFFDGTTLRNGITLTPGQVGDPNWQIRAVGDLNHDGHPDLIWQYAPTGQVAFWLMNGTTAIDYLIPNVMAPGGDWEIVGTGDSNRDGDRDIFWQQRSTGTLAVWWMTGTSIAGASLLSASPADPKWRVVGVVDVDGDAYSDLVLQHTDTRMTGAWYLQGSIVRFGLTLIPSSVSDPAWKIVGPR
jgi:VCBS repeat protein